MEVGDIVKISEHYPCDNEPDIIGTEVKIIKVGGRIFPYEGTLLSGRYMGSNWLFKKEELTA